MTKYITTLVLALTLLSAIAQTNNTMNDSKLTTRQLNLATCAALEAQGDMERLDKALRKALDEGVTVNELKRLSLSFMPTRVSPVRSMRSTF